MIGKKDYAKRVGVHIRSMVSMLGFTSTQQELRFKGNITSKPQYQKTNAESWRTASGRRDERGHTSPTPQNQFCILLTGSLNPAMLLK
jgi:hypothetical protein